MKRLSLLFTLLLASAFTLAADKDVAYYQEHTDEAKVKYDACEKRVAELAEAGKINEMMQVAEDPECKAADQVIVMRRHEI